MIEISNLNKKYGEHIIFENASLELPDKGFFVLDSDNGTGKTTFFKILVGICGDFSANFEFNYKKVQDLREHIEYIDQKNNYVSFLSIKQNIKIKHLIYGDEEIQIGDNYSKFLKRKKTNSLSEGEKILLILERCFKSDKEIVLIDEATASLDQNNTEKVVNKLIELSKTKLVLFSTHDSRVDTSLYNHIDIKDHKLIRVDKNEIDLAAKKSVEPEKKKKRFVPIKLFFSYLKSSFVASFSLLLVISFLCLSYSSFLFIYSYNPDYILNEDVKLSNFYSIEGAKRNYKYKDQDLGIETKDYLTFDAVNQIDEIKDSGVYSFSGIELIENSNEKLKIPSKNYKPKDGLILKDEKAYISFFGVTFSMEYEKSNSVKVPAVGYDYLINSFIPSRIGTNSIIFDYELDELESVKSIFLDGRKVYFWSIDERFKENGFNDAIELEENEIVVSEKYKALDGEIKEPFNLDDFELYSDRNTYLDLKKVFPSGIKVSYRDDISGSLKENDVLVSQGTMKALVNTLNFKLRIDNLKINNVQKFKNLIMTGSINHGYNEFVLNSMNLIENNIIIVSGSGTHLEECYSLQRSKWNGMDDLLKTFLVLGILLQLLLVFAFCYFTNRKYRHDFELLRINGLSKNAQIYFDSLKITIISIISFLPAIIINLTNPTIIGFIRVGKGVGYSLNPLTFNFGTFLYFILLLSSELVIVCLVNFFIHRKTRFRL